MKVYSDVLTEADLRSALPDGVYADVRPLRQARVRRFGWDVYLEGFGARHTRATNSGTYGAGSRKAVSYDDHGVWMARLYQIDPDARVSWWKSRADFEQGTKGKYSHSVAVAS